MNRRTFLRRTGAVGILGLAGCTGAGDSNDPGDDGGTGGSGSGGDGATPTETQTPPPTVTDYEIRTVDSGCKSDDVTVSVHKTESAVTISGTITASNPCYDPVLNAVSYNIGSDTLRVDVGVESTDEACADCVGAIEYEATVEFADGPPGTVTVSHEGDVVEASDGTTETPTASERTTYVDSSLTVTDVTSSATETTADVAFNEDDSTVVVTGTIQGSDGCKTAALKRVTYNRSDDRLLVHVETVDREGAQSCTEALVYIDYEATIRFEGGIPSQISVSHDDRHVLSGAYGSASASAPDDQS